MIELIEIHKAFRAVAAVEGVSLQVDAGHTTVLIGPSGCGKSTLLKLMLGLLRPDRGEVRFDGRPVEPSSSRTLRHQIGYVIQEGGLFPHMTARRNVTLTAAHLGWSRQRIDARLADLVDLTHIPGDALDRYPGQLSGGQRQRISLMRALMLDPRVLLMDEPLGALDPMIRADLQQDLQNVFRTLGKTVVMVTHDMGEASYFAGRIVLMRAGRIVQAGCLRDLLDAPADPFVTQFINAQRSPLDAMGAPS